ncbi:MAG: polysaccharide pyruvyl transferase family protein [Ruminococcus sp.]|nr:polysaccharide pyruvyl transferase family protein [Ruminococcus sp.]MDD6709380.1 polysaccharide pyruvyl transferase family protein [Ruminococcus sp.]
MKKICLAGLINFSNYGDQFIAKTVEYLVKKSQNVEICFLDFFHVYDTNIFSIGARIPTRFGGRKITEYELLNYQKKLYLKKLRGMNIDGIIFVCGSFKYATQDLYRNYSSIVWAAKVLNIPVMYDAMNIQKFDPRNVKCKILKKYANFQNVKVISSRDGYLGVERLKKDYIYNRNIKLLSVGDPALWIPECYSLSKKKSDIVGINVIRKDIFLDYGYNVSCNSVIQLYVQLLKILDKNKIPYKLFTNGLHEDFETALEVLKEYNKKSKKFLDDSIVIVPNNDRNNIEIISNFKSIIGARLHACICAYALDIPISGFIWDEKLKSFAICNGLESYFVDIENLNPEKIINNLCTAQNKGYNEQLRNEWKLKTLESIKNFVDEI